MDSRTATISRRALVRLAVAGLALLLGSGAVVTGQDGFRFRTGVALVNVTATVTDPSGRFVPGLQQSDFVVYEDDQLVEITHFSAERVPVSLGIVLDTSGSMSGQKIEAARHALERFLFELLGSDDEVFLYRFDNRPHLVAGWTTDRARIDAELRLVPTDGATALYDAVAAALPLLQTGRHRKKALLVISDGNDTSSRIELAAVKQLIHESEALVYAIGIDAQPAAPAAGGASPDASLIRPQRRGPFPIPMPLPGPRPPPRSPPIPGAPPGAPPARPPRTTPPEEPSSSGAGREDARVNAAALRELTDDSGGRTEIVQDPRDLGTATSHIADELSRQYYLGYASRAKRDGAWHAIRVEVRDRPYHVRARRGYVAAS